MRMFSVRAKILTIVLAFMVLAAMAFVLYSAVTTANYKEMRLDIVSKTVEFESEKVNKMIAQMERTAIDLAAGGLLCFEAKSEKTGEQLSLEIVRSFPDIVTGGIWYEPYAYKKDAEHVGFYAYYDTDSDMVRLDNILNDYEYHELSWYRSIADNVSLRPHRAVWTKPYKASSVTVADILMITIGAGIFDPDGNFVGISNVDWEIKNVVDKLAAIKPTPGSFVLLCDPDNDYIISNTYTNSDAGASLKSLPWDINTASFVLNGTTYRTFKQVMDNGWLLSVQIPTNEIFAEVEKRNKRFSLIIASSAIVMLFFMFLLISKLINNPIKKLMDNVTRLGQGDLDVHIDITTKDELGLLAGTFNKMTFQLKDFIEANARERAEKERIGTELNVATKIQAGMLPCIFPAFPNRKEFDIYAAMLPAKEVGGDFYDFFMIDENNLAVVIADVSGKGIPAALFMVISKTLIKNNACSGKSPKEVFELVNNMLCENNEAGMFVTAFMGYLNIPSGGFVYVNAGHNQPLIKKAGGEYAFLKTKPGFVLAGLENMLYQEGEITLAAGDTLYLYTDGVTEAMNASGGLFSNSRLLLAANKYKEDSLKKLLAAIKEEIDCFAAGAEQADDITMLALRISEKYQMKELAIDAALENLDKVLAFVNSELEQNNCSQKFRSQIHIAVEEIFVNIAQYAYKGAVGGVVIRICAAKEVVIEFEDRGVAYNPLEKFDPDTTESAENRELGGLGIFMVKKIMDKVEYRHIDNKNILTILKIVK